MVLPDKFIDSFERIELDQIVAFFQVKNKTSGWKSEKIVLKNEIKPVDIYCYLYARFGPPNGLQSLFRNDSSDNLIHWNWTLRYRNGVIDFQGHNFRTEVWFHGPFKLETDDAEDLVKNLKGEFKKFGPRISDCRKKLEQWIEFINPYQRLRNSVHILLDELKLLKIDKLDELPNILEQEDHGEAKKQWNEAIVNCSKGFGLCFGVRSMLPVMAEAFVNLVLFSLMKPEIKDDARLREDAFKRHIDIRIKSLSINCMGFEKKIDYTNEVCKKYHSLVNERNDLLHGNIDPHKLKFNDIYFDKKVPVFVNYRPMWKRTIGVESQSVGADKVSVEVSGSFACRLWECAQR